MTRAEFLSEILLQYSIVKVFSKKNNAEVLQLRHKALNKDLIFRSYISHVAAYQKLKTVQHENLPILYDVIDLDDGQAVLEEYIEGITVADILEERKYTYRVAKKVINSVCQALTVLHEMNIVHRDIKPENIIITKNGCVKLIDFNAARIHTTEKQTDTVPLGTIGYAPPEQFGISQSDEKSDIYSIGVLLNVMITGTHPSKKLCKGKAGKVVLKCTQIDPNSRFMNVRKLIDAL